jgi:hypothetical protein
MDLKIFMIPESKGFSGGKFPGNVCSLASGDKVRVGVVTSWK